MQAVVLSAVPAGHASMTSLASVLDAELARAGYDAVTRFDLTTTKLAGGGLALGGGGVVTPDRALEPHGPVAHVVRALDLAVPALAAGEGLPHEAIVAMAEAPMPDGLYRVMGDLGWRWQAHQNGVAQRELKARPLDVPRR